MLKTQKSQRRALRWLRGFSYLCLGVLLLGTLAIGLYAIVRGPIIPCLFDDGPFFGERIQDLAQGPPLSSLEIFRGMKIEAFKPQKENESPMVVLRDRNQRIVWSIRANGHQPGDVAELRFDEFDPPLFWYGVVVGQVRWTYGTERTYWYISRWGGLGGYCYSW